MLRFGNFHINERKSKREKNSLYYRFYVNAFYNDSDRNCHISDRSCYISNEDNKNIKSDMNSKYETFSNK
jgi:hypothetical protein